MADDLELFHKWREGDEKAGSQLFDRHFDSLFRFFRNKVDQAAEDLVQQTFLACVSNADNFRGDSSFRTYLYTVARSKLYDYLRTKRRKQDPLDFTSVSLAALGGTPSMAFVQAEDERLLQMALSRIPIELQVAVELFYFEEMAAPEVARILGIPEGTVRSRVRRALEKLREAIQEVGKSPDLIEASLSKIDALAESGRF